MSTDIRMSGSETTVDKKKGKFFLCKTDNFVLLLVPGVSSSNGTSSSSTSSSQDASLTSPDTERNDEFAPGDWGMDVKVFFLCKPYVTKMRQTLNKIPQTCMILSQAWIV